ncbi:MAG: PorT family protein [Myroides sp.]|jgi:hypothetical protein|nr:PorT family protein [Myroides sp.]
MNKKIICLGIVALLSCYTSKAQEVGIFFTPYFSKAIHTNKNMTEKSDGGLNVGLSYGQYLNKNFSIQIEPSYSQYNTVNGIDSFKGSLETFDRDNDAFILRYKGHGVSEKISQKQLHIPLMLQYETAGTSVRFFVKSGIAYGLQIENAKVYTKLQGLTTSGYYPEYDVELFEPNFVGFGNFDGTSQNNEIELKNRWSWVAEIGVKQRYNEKHSLYLGMFFDVGLNDMIKERETLNTTFIDYDREQKDPLLINSSFQSGAEKMTFKNFNIGIKLKYTLNFKKAKL